MAEQRLNLLDGLRGVAAFSVVLWHYRFFFLVWPDNPSLPNWDALQPGRPFLDLFYDHGFRAVELFWVISGFVFTHVYCFGRASTGRQFAANRIARLYPLHLVTLIVVALLQIAIFREFGRYLFFTENDAYHFLLNLSFISAWGFQRGPSFNDVIWSVSVEIAIYALFWLVHGKLSQWKTTGSLFLALSCGLIVLLQPPTFIFACGFYFFSGSALAFAGRSARLRPYGSLLLIAGLVALGALGLASRHSILSPTLGLTSAFGAITLALVELEGLTGSRVRDAARWLGECSYGVYLWHMPVLLLLVLLLAPVLDVARLAAEGWFLAAFLLGTLALARVSYVCLERPARGYLRRLCSGAFDRQPAQAAKIGG